MGQLTEAANRCPLSQIRPNLRFELNELTLAKVRALELVQTGKAAEGNALLEQGLADTVERVKAGHEYEAELEAAWRKALDDLVSGRGIRGEPWPERASG